MAKTLPERVIARVTRSWARNSFDRAARGILDTRPLQTRGESPLFLSMLRHADVHAYLLAIKSLYLQFEQGRVVVLNDGSLTDDDFKILNHHVPGIGAFDVAAISPEPCPRGGCWERLVKVLELSADNYVIQVDADILATAPTPELVRYWRENRSFLLGTDAGQTLSTAQDVARMVQSWIRQFDWNPISVGVEAEAALDRLPGADTKFYVHASAGFAGFSRGSFNLAQLAWFSTHMADILGAERWKQLGTEQIASNYILANAQGAAVLPFPRYACFEPGVKPDDSALLHFIGTYRYNSGVYRQHATKLISTIAH